MSPSKAANGSDAPLYTHANKSWEDKRKPGRMLKAAKIGAGEPSTTIVPFCLLSLCLSPSFSCLSVCLCVSLSLRLSLAYLSLSACLCLCLSLPLFLYLSHSRSLRVAYTHGRIEALQDPHPLRIYFHHLSLTQTLTLKPILPTSLSLALSPLSQSLSTHASEETPPPLSPSPRKPDLLRPGIVGMQEAMISTPQTFIM